MVENPVFVLKISMFPLYMAVGMSSLWCLEFFIIHLKTNIATLMAQEGVIVQITHCVILKYVKKINPPMFFKCNISVKDRYACICI